MVIKNKEGTVLINSKEPQTHTGELGRWIRERREACGCSLQDVSSVLFLKETYLQAIEDEDWEALPGYGYIVGFISTYTRYLGLESAEGIRRFKRVYTQQKNTGIIKDSNKAPRKNKKVLYYSGFAIILIFISVFIYIVSVGKESKKRVKTTNSERSSSIISETGKETILENKALKLAAKGQGPETHSSENIKHGSKQLEPSLEDQAILKARVNAWLEVKDIKKRVIYAKDLKAGEMFHFAGHKDLYINVRNAGAFDVIVQGKNIGRFGESGVPVTDRAVKDIKKTIIKN